jgi:hypothetical protein
MDSAIDLDNHFGSLAIKINNETTQWFLAAKSKTVYLTTFDSLPKYFFRQGHIHPEVS